MAFDLKEYKTNVKQPDGSKSEFKCRAAKVEEPTDVVIVGNAVYRVPAGDYVIETPYSEARNQYDTMNGTEFEKLFTESVNVETADSSSSDTGGESSSGGSDAANTSSTAKRTLPQQRK